MKDHKTIVSCVKSGTNVIVDIPFVDVRPDDVVFTGDEAIKVNTFCAGKNNNFITSDEGEQYPVEELLSGVKLIYGMPGIPDGVYVDTPENRAVLLKEVK